MSETFIVRMLTASAFGPTLLAVRRVALKNVNFTIWPPSQISREESQIPRFRSATRRRLFPVIAHVALIPVESPLSTDRSYSRGVTPRSATRSRRHTEQSSLQRGLCERSHNPDTERPELSGGAETRCLKVNRFRHRTIRPKCYQMPARVAGRNNGYSRSLVQSGLRGECVLAAQFRSYRVSSYGVLARSKLPPTVRAKSVLRNFRTQRNRETTLSRQPCRWTQGKSAHCFESKGTVAVGQNAATKESES